MLRDMKNKIILAIMVLFVVSCEPSKQEKISGTQDYNGVQFPITVHTFQTKRELEVALKDIKSHDEPVSGYSQWYLSKKTGEMSRCEIYVIVPEGEADEHMTTWGHELAHCVYGTYHREPK